MLGLESGLWDGWSRQEKTGGLRIGLRLVIRTPRRDETRRDDTKGSQSGREGHTGLSRHITQKLADHLRPRWKRWSSCGFAWCWDEPGQVATFQSAKAHDRSTWFYDRHTLEGDKNISSSQLMACGRLGLYLYSTSFVHQFVKSFWYHRWPTLARQALHTRRSDTAQDTRQ